MQFILVVSQISLIIIHLHWSRIPLLFSMAVSQNSQLNMRQPVKTHRRICYSASNLVATYYSDQSFQTVAAKCKRFGRLPLPTKEQSNKKLYYPSLLRFIGGNSIEEKTTKEAVCRVAAKVCTWHFRGYIWDPVKQISHSNDVTEEEGKHCWKI